MFTGKRTTKHSRIYERLRDDITSPDQAPGQRMASMRSMAKRLGASISTIQQVMRQLEADGYVELQHGAGAFVTSCHRPITMADTVTLCMQARGHLWSDLTALVMDALTQHGRIGVLLDLGGVGHSTAENEALVRRMAHSESSTMIVHAGGHFPFDIFKTPGMERKTVIAILAWGSALEWPGLHRVLHDRDAGAHLAADHLWSLGHRHVLVLGTSSQIRDLPDGKPYDDSPGAAFVTEWTARGGQWCSHESLPIPGGRYMRLDEGAFLAHFQGSNAPTAIFGCRDYDVWLAQNLLQHRSPDLLRNVAMVGYGNTPWSEAAQPAFTTIDFDLERIVSDAMEVMKHVDAGSAPAGTLIRVAPRLIVRDRA